jgi:hypothetical protein
MLATAICETAADDLRRACRFDAPGSRRVVVDCESFFRSDWFAMLSGGLDGETAIHAIKRTAGRRT